MTDYYVNSVGGDGTTGTSWATGELTLGAAILSATNPATDTIYVASDHSENAGVWAYTLPTSGGLKVICADRTSGEPPTTLATGASVGGGSANAQCTFAGCAYFYGVTFLGSSAANAAADIVVGIGTVAHNLIFESCTIHARGNNAGAFILLGATGSTANDEIYIKLINTALGVGNAGSSIVCRNAKVEGVGVTLMGTTGLTNLFLTETSCAAQLKFSGCDLSAVTYFNIVNGVASTVSSTLSFSQCKFDPYTLALSTTSTLLGNAEVFLHDCDTGDTHGTFGYFNALGSVVSDTNIKLTAGAAGQSWKVTANANASHAVPFCTPWLGYYNSTLGAAITPYIEILRVGASPAAYQHDETWMEVLCKSTSTSPASTLSTGRMPLLGTAADINAGTGYANWATADSNDQSQKLQLGTPASPATVTPAENGHIMARVCMAVNDTVYVDPFIRT